MKKSFVLTCSALVAFALLAESADAEKAPRRRKIGFFEALFGGFDRPRRRERQPAWWEEDVPPVRVIREPKPKKTVAAPVVAKKRKVLPAVAYDPDTDEGLGMGNIVYAQPTVVALFDPSFSKLSPAAVDAAAVRVVLTDKSTDIRALPEIRKAVLAHYKATDFKPLWTKDDQITERAIAVLSLLSQADREGLDPLRYKPAVLKNFESVPSQLDGDRLSLAQLDVGLTVAAITYAMHQSGGAYEPQRLSAYFDLKPQRVSPEVALRVLAYSPFPAAYLTQLAPTHPAYVAMKAELANIVSPTGDVSVEMPDGKRVRIGQKDPRIALLRARLLKDGLISFVDSDVPEDKRLVLDKVLAKALKKFQEDNGIGQTSNLDSATVKALNGPDKSDQREKLLSSMERVRWLPDSLGRRHVFVNQASYRTQLIEDGKTIWSSNVIVGKPLTQTAVFSDVMETVVFNPTWGVPQSIILNEYLPKLRSNPGYLDKIGFKVYGKDGKVVSSRKVDWYGYTPASTVQVVQPAGDGNALGDIKFLFPNKHSIYMHDTPNRGLFKEKKRNFSHGCVRVENPRDFASVLLGVDRPYVDGKIEGGESISDKITRRTDVHLTYFTAWPDETGKMQYYSDPYGRDSTLADARKLMRKLVGGSGDSKLVEASAEKTFTIED
jgi:murein L,D-transpeptidase YcbB/YkuD